MDDSISPPTTFQEPEQQGPQQPVPRWQDVAATAKFQEAAPEKKLIAFDRWQQAARPYVSSLPNHDPAAFETGVQNRMAEYSRAAGGIDPTGARIKVAGDAVAQATEANVADPTSTRTSKDVARDALRPLGHDVFQAYLNAHPLPPLPTNPDALPPSEPKVESISAEPTVLGEAAKGHLITAATMAYNDVRDNLSPFFGVTERQKIAESIPWGKNPDGSQHFEYRPLGGGPDEQGLIPGLMKMAMVNPETLVRASGADADKILYYPHDAEDSTGVSLAKGTFNAAQGLLQTFLSPTVLLGFGGASPAAQKWISGAFTADMASKIGPSIKAANNAQNPQEFVQNLLEAATSIAFAGKAGEHALTPTPKVFGPTEIASSVGDMSDHILQVAGSSPEFAQASPRVADAVKAELDKRGLQPATPTQIIGNGAATPKVEAAAAATQVIDDGANRAQELESTGSPLTAKVAAEQANQEGAAVAQSVPVEPPAVRLTATVDENGELTHKLDVNEKATPEQLEAFRPTIEKSGLPAENVTEALKELDTLIAERTPSTDARNTPAEVREGLKGMAKGISQSFFDSAFKALQEGKNKIAGIPDPILKKAKPFFDAGLIKSAEEFHSLYQDGTIEKGYKAPEPAPDAQKPLPENVLTQGKLGETHQQLSDAIIKNPDSTPEQLDAAIAAGTDDKLHGFVDSEGNVLDRKQAAEVAFKAGQIKPEFASLYPEGKGALQSQHLQEAGVQGNKIEGPALLKETVAAPAPAAEVVSEKPTSIPDKEKPMVDTQLGVPEGVKTSAKPAPVPLGKLPTINEGGVIKPAWTNDPLTIAHQIDAGAIDTHANGKGNRLYIPEEVMDADPPVLDPRIQFATEKQPDGSFRDYVTGVDHEKYGPITDKGQYTERYEQDKEVQARREAQTKGKEFQLTQERPAFDEKLNALPAHEKEGELISQFTEKVLDPYIKERGKELNTTLTDRIRDAALKEATYRLRKDGTIKAPKSIIKSIEATLTANIENQQSFDQMVANGDPVAKELADSPYEQISDIHFGTLEEASQPGAVLAKGEGPVDSETAKKNLAEANRLGLRGKPNARTILTRLAESKNEGIKLIAKALLEAKVDLAKLKFKLYNDPKDTTAASYMPNLKDVSEGLVHVNLGMDQPISVEASVLHEIGHHFTLAKLGEGYERTPVEEEAFQGIKKAYDRVSREVFEANHDRPPENDAELAKFQKDSLESGGINYWIGDIHEFVQSVLTEPRAQGQVAALSPDPVAPKLGKFAGLLDSLKAWLNQIFVGRKIASGSPMETAVNDILTLATETTIEHGKANVANVEDNIYPLGTKAIKGPSIVTTVGQGSTIEGLDKATPSQKDALLRQIEASTHITAEDKVKLTAQIGEPVRVSGIAQRVREAQGVPVEPGVGTTPKAAIARGQELKKAGADPEARLAAVAKANYAANADDMSLFRAHDADLRAAYFKAVDAKDPVAAKAALDAHIEWAKKIKPVQTEWSKIGAAQQGETEIDTGSYHGLQYDFVTRTGRDFTPKEAETAKDIVATSKKADADIAAKSEEFTKALTAEAAKVPIEPAKPARKAKGPAVPTDADGLNKYFAEKFKNHTSTEAKFTQPEIVAVWKYVKENFIDGNTPIDLGELVATISSEIGLRPVWVRQVLAAPKTLRVLNAELYKAQTQRTAVLRAARTWVAEATQDPLLRKLETIWNFRRALSVLGHVNAPLTHAGSSLFVPNEFAHMISSVKRGFQYFRDPVFHRAQMESILQDGNYSEFAKAGLGIKPGLVEDVAEYQHIFGKFGVAGDRGMDILKTMRLERMNQRVAQLPPDLRADPEVIKEMAQLVNVETGLINKGVLGEALGTKLARNTLFAARLEGSRWQNLFINTTRAGRIFTRWGTATPAEQVFAKHVLRRNATLAAVYLSALGANQAALSASKSDDAVNFTDPTKSDWLAFKWNGHVVGAPSSFLSPLRFVLGLVATPFTKGANQSSVGARFGDYVAGKANPTISDIAELIHGKQLFTGRPLPWMQPSKLRSGKTPLSYPEYALSKSPIPISQVAQEISNTLIDNGIDGKIADVLVNASLAGFASIFAVHTHPVHEDKKKKTKAQR